MIETIIGVLLALVSTLMFNLAPIIQKGLVDEIPEIKISSFWSSLKAMFSSPRWLFGAILGIIGGLPYFIALEMAGILVVQPLMNFGFIAMVFAAKRMLNESLDVKSMIAIGLMILMPLFIAFADVSQAVQFESPFIFLIYNVIISGFIGLFALLGKKVNILWAFSGGLCFSLGALNMQALTLNLDFSQIDTIVSQFIEVLHWAALSIVFNGIGTFITQIGLQKNKASKFNPINQTINNVSALLGGVFIFLQIPGSILLYAIGFVIGGIGVVILGKYEITDEFIEEHSM